MSERSDSSDDINYDSNDDLEDSTITNLKSWETYKPAPPDNSILDCYLRSVKEDVMNNKSVYISEGKNWVPPKYSAIGGSRLVNETSKWISSNTWCYKFFCLSFSMQVVVVLVFSNINAYIIKLEVLKAIATSGVPYFGMIRLFGFYIEDFYANHAIKNLHL